MLAKLLSGDLTAEERELGGAVSNFPHGGFLRTFLSRPGKQARGSRARPDQAPQARQARGHHRRMAAVEGQGTREHDRASIIARKLKLGDHYVRRVIAPKRAAERDRIIALRKLKKSEPERFE